jgi:protocatechuate 3,4-dioxygenase beta subunit
MRVSYEQLPAIETVVREVQKVDVMHVFQQVYLGTFRETLDDCALGTIVAGETCSKRPLRPMSEMDAPESQAPLNLASNSHREPLFVEGTVSPSDGQRIADAVIDTRSTAA